MLFIFQLNDHHKNRQILELTFNIEMHRFSKYHVFVEYYLIRELIHLHARGFYFLINAVQKKASLRSL